MRFPSTVVIFLLLGYTLSSPTVIASEGSEWKALSDLEISVSAEQVEELFRVYATDPTAEDWFRSRDEDFEARFSTEAIGALEASLPDWEVTLPESPITSAYKALEGWKIALDPGHLGGEWGPMESRSFRIGDGPVAQEGDLVLAAAFHLKSLLQSMGAEVLLLRDSVGPVTPLRPEDFVREAAKEGSTLTEVQTRRLFLREDIRERGRKLENWGAHVVFAMHVNASTWPDPENYSFVDGNHGHVLVNGAYLDDELASEEQRLFLARRWLAGFHEIELGIASAVALSMAEATGLEPFNYTRSNAVRVNDNPFVWGRNLMAARLFRAPVVYLEPWVLNSEEVYPWGSLGDYSDTRLIDGVERASLPRVYAAFVAEGMRRFAIERAE